MLVVVFIFLVASPLDLFNALVRHLYYFIILDFKNSKRLTHGGQEKYFQCYLLTSLLNCIRIKGYICNYIAALRGKWFNLFFRVAFNAQRPVCRCHVRPFFCSIAYVGIFQKLITMLNLCT